MMTLVDVAHGDYRGPPTDRAVPTTTAPDDIARWIVTLNAWRLANYNPLQGADLIPQPPFASAKKLAATTPLPAAQERNTKGAAGFTKRSHQRSLPNALRSDG